MKSENNYGIIALVGTIIILIAAFVFFDRSPDAPQISYAPVEITGSSITVSNQKAESVVTLNAHIVRAGYISIHKSISAAPAEVIGVSDLLQPGDYKNLAITVLPMLPGNKYITLLTVDDGDLQFVAGKDLPVKSDDKVVRPDFIYKP